MKEKVNFEHYGRMAFVIFAFCLFFMWSILLPVDAGPDEVMKYDIIEYIVKSGKLPFGDDEAVRNPMWGLSYAYFPILSYMISAVFVKVTTIITTSLFKFYVAARFTSVLFGTGMVFMSMKISDKLFEKSRARWLFIIGVSTLPQISFLNSYINNDSMALFSISLIIYFWLCAMESGWDVKSCLGLGVGAGICAMSYYNAYGYLLTSVILYVSYFILHREKRKIFASRKFWCRALLMCVVAFAIAGWWFIRSALRYDGDFLGLVSMDQSAQKYAIDPLKPSNMKTPENMGQSLFYMLFQRKWIKTSLISFIAGFGGNNIFMSLKFYCVYGLVAIVSIFGGVWKILYGIRTKSWKKNKDYILLRIIFILNIIIPLGLSVYYSYCSDFQPQGRYLMPALIPIMFFLTRGIEWILERCLIRQGQKRAAYGILYLAAIISPIFCLFRVLDYFY